MNRTRQRGIKWILSLLAICGMLFTHGAAVAQDGYPITPQPDGCTVEPRTVEEVQALFMHATPIAETDLPPSVVVPTGNPADLAAIQGVTETIHEAFACLNGNAYFNFFSLLTDSALTTNFYWVGEMMASGEIPQEFLTPEAQPEEYQQTIIAISSISRLTADGRVGAIVVSIDPTSSSMEPRAMFLILTLVGDRWLVDEVIEFSV